jgi:hypothetical protein
MKRAVLLLVLVPTPLRADDVFLKGAGQISGRIVSRTATSLEVDVGAGTVTVPLSNVERVVEGRSPLDDYHDRATRLQPGDREGWRALARWASGKGLSTQAEQAWKRVLAVAPDDAEANQALGRVKVGNQWMTEAEGYRARGYVEFEGDWITPAEHQAILKGREAEQRADESEARAREAEARAQAAEARAQEAQAAAQAQQDATGIPMWTPPVWNSWGPGPIAWEGTKFRTNFSTTPGAGRPPQ